LLNETPQTTIEFYATGGVIHYFDSLENDEADETSFNGGLGFNWVHRVSERLRLVSRNYIKYELEPDYTTGVGAGKQVGSYLHWSSSNAVGYRWTERLGTYTGITISGLDYEESSASAADRFSWTAFNDFRYQISPQTVGTLTYRYQDIDGKDTSDSTRQYILAGVEHRVSPNTVFSIKAGVQIRDVDDASGGDSTSPHVESALRANVNEAFSVSAYARYSNDDYNKWADGAEYEGSDSLRIGVRGSYKVSPDLSINGGVNYATFDYTDALADGVDDLDEDILNLHIGFAYRVSEGMYVNGRYNFSDFGSDESDREYDRNRFNLGVSAEF